MHTDRIRGLIVAKQLLARVKTLLTAAFPVGWFKGTDKATKQEVVFRFIESDKKCVVMDPTRGDYKIMTVEEATRSIESVREGGKLVKAPDQMALEHGFAAWQDRQDEADHDVQPNVPPQVEVAPRPGSLDAIQKLLAGKKGLMDFKVGSERKLLFSLLTMEQRSLIHEGLQVLLKNCDGAQSRDGVGFSKYDAWQGNIPGSGAGAQLARKPKSEFVRDEYSVLKGLLFMKKYREQIGQNGLYSKILKPLGLTTDTKSFMRDPVPTVDNRMGV